MFKEILMMAIQALIANKLRSILSALGIFIGVFSIILILTVMDGFKFYVNEQFSSLGGNTIYINKFPFIITSYEDYITALKRRPIAFSVYTAVKKESTLADYVSIVVRQNQAIKKEGESRFSLVVASDEMEPYVDNVEVADGRFFTAAEVRSASRVAIIGHDILEFFFPNQSPIGQNIKIDGMNYSIIGIAKKRGTIFGQSQDDVLYIPYTTLKNKMASRRGLTVAVKTNDATLTEDLKDELRGIVRRVRKNIPGEKDDFALNEINSLNTFFETMTASLYLTVAGISMICLVVGGVGIANIMVVSVTERTKEIGIRKAIGANQKSILLQFLSEASVISLVGGLPGILAGILAGFLVLNFMEIGMPLPLMPIIIGFTFSIFIGVMAGFFPALNASKLKPVKALSYE